MAMGSSKVTRSNRSLYHFRTSRLNQTIAFMLLYSTFWNLKLLDPIDYYYMDKKTPKRFFKYNLCVSKNSINVQKDMRMNK